jgi:hypothetical protein
MVDELSIPPEIAELMHREELLRRAGEELLNEANVLRAKYEGIIVQLRTLKEQGAPTAHQAIEPRGK